MNKRTPVLESALISWCVVTMPTTTSSKTFSIAAIGLVAYNWVIWKESARAFDYFLPAFKFKNVKNNPKKLLLEPRDNSNLLSKHSSYIKISPDI